MSYDELWEKGENSQLTQTADLGLRWQNFKDLFKPAIEKEILSQKYHEEEMGELTDIQKININTAQLPLKRKLKNRHLQMIAIALSIGLGLFIGTGGALADGGPAAIIIGWTVTSIAIYLMMCALGELTVTFPISGSFNVYALRFIDPSVGFAVAWNYVFQFLTLLPLELVAASMTVGYWNSTINPDAWVAIFYVVTISINMFGVRAYGEVEFWVSALKVLAVIGFVICLIVLAAGGGPDGHHYGDKYWHDPGAFANGFKGVALVFITLAFLFGGTELVGLTAAEAHNPRQSLPKAIKQVFWRILLFYMLLLILITFLVPYNDDKLALGDVRALPFVIAIVNAGILGLPLVMNAVVLILALSVGSLCVYATLRTLTALAEQGLAPKIIGYVDRAGRPLVAITITNIFGLIAFVAASNRQAEVFDWLLAISALSLIFTWMSICIAHMRFRRALKVQGRTPDELAFKAPTGVFGSLVGAVIMALVVIAQFWLSLFPIGESPNAAAFFEADLGLVILVVFYVGHKLWKRDLRLFIRARDIDVDTGRRETDIEAMKEELEEERRVLASKPLYIRLWNAWC